MKNIDKGRENAETSSEIGESAKAADIWARSLLYKRVRFGAANYARMWKRLKRRGTLARRDCVFDAEKPFDESSADESRRNDDPNLKTKNGPNHSPSES